MFTVQDDKCYDGALRRGYGGALRVMAELSAGAMGGLLYGSYRSIQKGTESD